MVERAGPACLGDGLLYVLDDRLQWVSERAYALVRGLRLPPPASLGQRPTPKDPGNSRSSYLLGTCLGLRLLFLAGLVDGAAVPEDDADVLARIVAGAFAGEPDVDALARASLADRPARRDAYTV